MQLFLLRVKIRRGVLVKAINLAYMPLIYFFDRSHRSRTSLIAIIPFGIFVVGTQQIKLNQKIFLFSLLLVSLLSFLPFVPHS